MSLAASEQPFPPECSITAVLVTYAVSVAGHTSGSKPALMARHARPAREAVSSVSQGRINTHVRRTCRSKPTTSVVSTPVDTLPNAPVTASTPATLRPTPSAASALLAAGPIGGLVNVVSAGSCGPSGATSMIINHLLQITALSGPNGNIDFLNCGLTSGGWTPPLILINGIISVKPSQVAYNPGSAFSACKDFVSLFEEYGRQYGVPAIMLASFAMQESSCIPTTVGGAGEQGLMQITVDKCDGAPGGNCQDPDFNIHKGAQFFSQTLESVNGDLLLAIGHYNGWYKGLTYAEATAAAHNGHCREQNNLDYLHQFLNGWMLAINAYETDPPLGKYFNINNCSN
ncbi:glycoside hydrolase family 23 protein [Boletus coccyginus]|nr:glycoside hydrolase family 23 protein [Boletus coccyginus]